LVAARCCTGTKERSFGMSKRKRARALHRWEPAHSEKLRKFDLGCSVAAAKGDGILSSLIGRIELETDRAGYCRARCLHRFGSV
jgi:hypothetical protein